MDNGDLESENTDDPRSYMWTVEREAVIRIARVGGGGTVNFHSHIHSALGSVLGT